MLGIEAASQLTTHHLRGAIFENWVIAEVAKYFANRGQSPPMFFYPDQRGAEVDLVIERSTPWMAVEIKSAATPSVHFYDAIAAFAALVRGSRAHRQVRVEPVVVYGGAETQPRTAGTMLSWSDIDGFRWNNGGGVGSGGGTDRRRGAERGRARIGLDLGT